MHLLSRDVEKIGSLFKEGEPLRWVLKIHFFDFSTKQSLLVL